MHHPVQKLKQQKFDISNEFTMTVGTQKPIRWVLKGNLTRTVNVISKETYDSQCLIKDIEFRKFDEEV